MNFRAYQDDREEVIARALSQEIGMITVGTNRKTSKEAIAIAEQHDGVYASIGLHPIHLTKDITENDIFEGEEYTFTTTAERFDKRDFFELAKSDVVVAVGECGLDYFHLDDYIAEEMTTEEYKDLQKETFYEILGFAREIDKPLIIHCRDAYEDLIEILSAYGDNSDNASAQAGIHGVVHCFGGTLEQAQQLMDIGLYIGLTCIVTFPKANEVQEIATKIPLERLLVETDAPYLAPQEHRGKRNEPSYVQYAVKKIAELRGISYDEVAEQTTKNTRELFQLP